MREKTESEGPERGKDRDREIRRPESEKIEKWRRQRGIQIDR